MKYMLKVSGDDDCPFRWASVEIDREEARDILKLMDTAKEVEKRHSDSEFYAIEFFNYLPDFVDEDAEEMTEDLEDALRKVDDAGVDVLPAPAFLRKKSLPAGSVDCVCIVVKKDEVLWAGNVEDTNIRFETASLDRQTIKKHA